MLMAALDAGQESRSIIYVHKTALISVQMNIHLSKRSPIYILSLCPTPNKRITEGVGLLWRVLYRLPKNRTRTR